MNELNVRALEKDVAIAAGEQGIQILPPAGATFDVIRALAKALAARGVLAPAALTDADCQAAIRGMPEGYPKRFRAELERTAKGEL
jgi:hypothetical protein